MLQVVTLFALAVLVIGDSIPSDLEKHFVAQCPPGYTVSKVQSNFNRVIQDRQWVFACRLINKSTQGKCAWTDWINEFHEHLVFQCPGDQIMSGVQSAHDVRLNDRRFKFYCCEVPEYIAHACQFTPYQNKYRDILNYKLPAGWYMRGLESVSDKEIGDRRFQFDICRLDRLTTDKTGGGAIIG